MLYLIYPNRFILSNTFEDISDDYGDSLSYPSGSDTDDAYEIRKKQQKKKRGDLLKRVNFKKLVEC